jgi:hypothetical protein
MQKDFKVVLYQVVMVQVVVVQVHIQMPELFTKHLVVEAEADQLLLVVLVE